MKKIIPLILTSLFIVISGFSQKTEPLELKKWTLRSIIFSQPYTFERNNPLPSFFTGIGAKMNYEKISYRFSFQHINYINEDESRFQKGYIKESTVRIGAEYKKNYYNIINLNFFLDAGLVKMYQETNQNNIDSNLNVFKKFDGYAGGAIFGIGFDYFITSNFSLSLETRLDLIHLSGNFHKEDFFDKYTVNYVISNNRFNLNILGDFTLNYHF